MKTSCEPWRSSAYNVDLRWRMIWQRKALGLTYDTIANNLGVDKSTILRTVHLFNNTGSLLKKPYPKERASRKLTSLAQQFVLNLILQKPGIYLHEIQEELQHSLLLEVSMSTLCKFLHASGFTRQRLQTVASQLDKSLRLQFSFNVSVYSPEMFVFVDETGADRRNTLRKYGYSIRGKPPKRFSFLSRGKHISAIACMSTAGLLDVKTHAGTVDGEVFYGFVQTRLLPKLMPYNGTNPHSVVVLDNCAIHHVNAIVKSIEEVGALVYFLPPYSPDLNPIEELFSKVKTELKSLELQQETQCTQRFDLETLLLASFTSITEEDCNGWIMDSEIYM